MPFHFTYQVESDDSLYVLIDNCDNQKDTDYNAIQTTVKVTIAIDDETDEVGEGMKRFLVSLQKHSLNRKMAILDEGELITDSFDYDFNRLQENGFQGSPSEYKCPMSKIEYRCNEALLERAGFYQKLYSDQSIVKRKLLYESRSDDLDEFFRATTATIN